MFKIVNMKIILSILFISAATVVTIFFTAPQFMCTKDTCSYDGIKKLKTDQNSYITALSNAEDLDLRRTDLETKYNSVSAEDKQKLENLLPNNVDNIKLVLELETLAKKYGLLIESPKLQNEVETIKPGAPAGQDIRGTSSAVSYGTFSLDFTVRSSYENAKIEIENLTNILAKETSQLKGIVQLIIYDDFEFSDSINDYLWITYTRSNPSHDIYGVNEFINHKHWGCDGPMLIDARKKPHHAPELKLLPETEKSIERFFAKGAILEKWA